MTNLVVKLIRQWRYGDDIIVVSGVPRSGTSMLMKMLAAGGFPIVTDHIRMADEDNPEGYFEYERVKELANDTDKSWVREARGKGLKVISHLLKELPDENFYRIILAHRDLREVIASQNIMLKRRLESNSISEERALELYRKHLLNVRLLIRRKPNFELLEVSYDEAVADPQACAKRINQFLGGRLDIEEMARAIEPRVYRNRNPNLRKSPTPG